MTEENKTGTEDKIEFSINETLTTLWQIYQLNGLKDVVVTIHITKEGKWSVIDSGIVESYNQEKKSHIDYSN